MTPFRAEFWLLWRDRAAVFWLAIAVLMSAVSVTTGLEGVSAQRAALARLQTSDVAERHEVAQQQTDWGGVAYYTFHLAYDAPSTFAFAALGQRELMPWKHRIRMLALEGQIYETDADNPTLALVGRLDFAFVASTLLPLFVIFLLHGLRAGERGAGRWELLVATAGSEKFWTRRALVRIGPLVFGLLVPLALGGLVEQSGVAALAAASLVVCLHAAFWWWLSGEVGKRARSSAVSLTALMGIWLGFAVVAPAALRTAIERSVIIPEGASILLSQREAVNDAWDLPKSATMEPFVQRHPEWRDQSRVSRPFEWKWYYAFQQVADQKVEELSQAYRSGRARRDQRAGWLSFLSPVAWTERALQGFAQTDVAAMLAYEQSVRDFHAKLRTFYYPKIFLDQPIDLSAIARRPEFKPQSR